MTTFAKGDIVFNEHGQRFEYVIETDGEHIVRPTVETDEEEPWSGSHMTLRKVFASAPREMYDPQIEALNKRIQELDGQKRALEAELRASKADETERKKRIMTNAALERIDDFLAGKITHIVFGDYDLEIKTFDEAVRYKDSEYEKTPKELRLLILYGRSNGDLAWKLSHYYDGSGFAGQVWPCFSLEHARTVAQSLIDGQIAMWRANPTNMYIANSAVSCADKLDLSVPDDVRAMVVAHVLKSATEHRDKMQQQFAEAQAKVDAAMDKATELNA